MTVNVQEAYRTTNRFDKKRKSSLNIIIKTLNELNNNKNSIKTYKWKRSSNI